MFKVVTKNSVYTVRPEGAGFTVARSADMWGRKVNDSKRHFTGYIRVVVGSPFVTSVLRTSAVLAVIPA
jgi:hypothetical protein